MLADMPLIELIEWYEYHYELSQADGAGSPRSKQNSKRCYASSAEEEIALFKMATGGGG